MSTTTGATQIKVTEYANFKDAFSAATTTKKAFDAFQMHGKKAIIATSERFFVDDNNELWYCNVCRDGLRVIHKAEVHSMLSNSPFRIVEIVDGSMLCLTEIFYSKSQRSTLVRLLSKSKNICAL